MPAAVQERLIRLWASPQGAAKAALPASTETSELGANPGTLLADGVTKAGKTSVSWEARQAGRDVPDSGRSGSDRDRHARREVHGRDASWSRRDRRPPSSPTATTRTGTTR